MKRFLDGGGMVVFVHGVFVLGCWVLLCPCPFCLFRYGGAAEKIIEFKLAILERLNG